MEKAIRLVSVLCPWDAGVKLAFPETELEGSDAFPSSLKAVLLEGQQSFYMRSEIKFHARLENQKHGKNMREK